MCFQNAFPDAVRLRSTFQSPPLLKIAELALDEAEQERQKTHKGQIEHAGIEQRPGDTLGLHKSFTGHGDLNDGDGPGQRGVLHQRDDLIGHGGDDPLDHLQKGDLEEDLPLGQAQHLTGFPLTCRDALNAAPVDHGEIAGVVDDKGDAAGSHASVPEGVPRICAKPGAGTVEDDDELENQRRTPDDPDDDVGQGGQGPELGEPAGKAPRFLLPVGQSPEGRPLAHGAEGHYQTKGQREQQRQEKQLDRLTTALQDGEGNSPEHERILLYVVIMGGTKGEEGKRMREICRSKAESDRSLPLLYDLRNYLVTTT